MNEERNFLKACEAWDFVQVQKYLDKGVDVNLKVAGNFALKCAARPRKIKDGNFQSGIQLLELLLACPNINVNNKDDEGITAFMLACMFGSLEVAERMLSFPDLNINQCDNQGRTAFMWACLNERRVIGDRRMMIIPVIHPFHIYHRVRRGTPAFMWECRSGSFEIAHLMLNIPGLDINHHDHYGDTAFMWACRSGYMGFVDLMLQNPKVDIICRDNRGDTALMMSCRIGHSAIVEKLLDHMTEHDDLNVDWNLKNDRGEDVFTIALRHCSGTLLGLVDIVHQLLNISSLKPDVQSLKKMDVFKKAASLCRKFVTNKMTSSGIIYSPERFSPGNLYAYAVFNGMKNIVPILVPNQDEVESCRLRIAERMSNDENLLPQHNMTELVYALMKGMDNLALVLASSIKGRDILLMCKIFHVEEEKLRLAAEKTLEDGIPRKRCKVE